MSELKEQDMKKFVSRADFGGIISLDTSKRLKIQSKKEPGELPQTLYNRMPSNRDGMMFVPKNNRETLLTSCNDSYRNSES